MRLIAYARVSTDRQADDGVSLADQEARCAAYAVAGGHDVVRTEVDAARSARDLDRPALARALASIRSGEADAILVTRLDRLTRSVRDLAHLVETGVGIVSISESIDTSSAAGRMVLNMLGAVAQWEREAIGERTRAALRHVRANGTRLGRPPVTTPEEAARARALRAEGASYAKIAEALSTPERRWSANAALRACRRNERGTDETLRDSTRVRRSVLGGPPQRMGTVRAAYARLLGCRDGYDHA